MKLKDWYKRNYQNLLMRQNPYLDMVHEPQPPTKEFELCWDWELVVLASPPAITQIGRLIPPEGSRYKERILYWGSHYWGKTFLASFPVVARLG